MLLATNPKPVAESPSNIGTFLTQNSEASLIWARPIHKDASSDEFFTQVHCLMDTCLEERPCCQQRPKSRLPTRVIDVGSQEREAFLLVTEGRIGDWATLSHCWGGTPEFTTKISTLGHRCNGLPFLQLRPLFRDAIVITRRLGYPYLGIDAICIIQDSNSDWLAE